MFKFDNISLFCTIKIIAYINMKDYTPGGTYHGGPGSDSDTSRCELRGHAPGAPLGPLSARIGLKLHHVRDLKDATKGPDYKPVLGYETVSSAI